MHRFSLRPIADGGPFEILISSKTVSLRTGEAEETLTELKQLKPDQWYNLQLTLELNQRLLSGRIGSPGSVNQISAKSFSTNWSGRVDQVQLDGAESVELPRPAISFDNLGIESIPTPEVSTQLPQHASDELDDPVELTKRLNELTRNDGDLELQTDNAPPVSPWNPGPNSLVKLSASSQSPFRNIFPQGELGIHLPNRGQYDGFGWTLTNLPANPNGKLHVSFDFRCGDMDAGGEGSWRYYLGHGPGNSAAVQLFFNGRQFFQSADSETKAVCELDVGTWYQVQLILDLDAKAYSGMVSSVSGSTTFSGPLATGWDGKLDYAFIDSFGHIQGVRPSLDADNFAISDTVLPSFEAANVRLDEEARKQRLAKIAKIRQQLAEIQANTDQLTQELNKLMSDGPFEMTYGMAEGTPHNVRVQIRGEPDQLGAEVPRGFLKILGSGELPAETDGSGRLELANWLTRSDNPLPARVMVNRIWQYHFGRGLVKTPNDFGVRGLPPTHPELLDHLATEFVRSGWSVKAMHRLIMNSATYQQSSARAGAESTISSDLDLADAIPTADLYVSFPRRRLRAEEIRDSILAISGELDRSPAQEHPFPPPLSWRFTQHAPFTAVYDHNKRSVYLMTQRLKRHPFLGLFDGADPNATTASRLVTTVPTQALFFLNDPFVHTKTEKWAARLMASHPEQAQQIEQSSRQAFGRSPTQREQAEAKSFLAAYSSELEAAKIENVELLAMAAYLRTLIGSNEFLHVD